MCNPLNKRHIRELKNNWGKYLVIFLFMVCCIGFTSGIFIANNSMIKAIEEGRDYYHLEDGHFVLSQEADSKLISKLEEVGNLKIYPDFYREEQQEFPKYKIQKSNHQKTTIRIYTLNNNINQVDIMAGRLPKSQNEIAIDNMHARNHHLKVGNSLIIHEKKYTIVGLISFVNYSALFEDNSQFMFDAIHFNLGLVTDTAFKSLDSPIKYAYPWLYEVTPENDYEAKKKADDFLEELVPILSSTQLTLDQFVPEYMNKASNFVPDDMGSDASMCAAIMYIIIIALAFVFAIMTTNTINREASVIGTLRASGYSRAQLIIHYLQLPCFITLLAALVGNLLGYTFFKNIVVEMYYNSYSLMTYKTLWNPYAFLLTTLIPLLSIFLVNLLILTYKMHFPVDRFLSGNLQVKRKKTVMPLTKGSFLTRFRLRILGQNLINYVFLFFGMIISMTLLMFAYGFPDSLAYYQDHLQDMSLAKNITVLRGNLDQKGQLLETKAQNWETIGFHTLIYKSDNFVEDVSVYGIFPDSSYISHSFQRTQPSNKDKPPVTISSAYGEKYRLKPGDVLTLKERYENKTYDLQVQDIYDYRGELALFLPIHEFNSLFGYEEDYYNAFLSQSPVDDIDEKYIAGVIDSGNIHKLVQQLDHSMGGYMTYFQILCLLLSSGLIFLLTKIIIEKNEKPISFLKVLGYKNTEIANLYIKITGLLIPFFEFLAMVFSYYIAKEIFRLFMMKTSHWFNFQITGISFMTIFLLVLIGYMIVAFFDMNRIKKIPLDLVIRSGRMD